MSADTLKRAQALKSVAPPGTGKQRATIHIPVDLLDKMRDAVYSIPGLTMSNLVDEAVRKHLVELEKKQKGGVIPKRVAENKGGRPVKM